MPQKVKFTMVQAIRVDFSLCLPSVTALRLTTLLRTMTVLTSPLTVASCQRCVSTQTRLERRSGINNMTRLSISTVLPIKSYIWR